MVEYLKSVTKECHEKMLEQMNNSICIINERDGRNEIGLFCKIKNKNEYIPILLINKNINNDNYQDKINVLINNENKIIELDNILYKNNNISMIKIKKNYNFVKLVEIDNKLWENESEMYFYNESIYIIQYNNKNDILISYGVIKEINNNKLN